MEIKKKVELKIEITKEELFDIIEKSNNVYEISNFTLGLVSWHDNMPTSSKLKYISMLEKHISEFRKTLYHNNDLTE